MDFGLRPLAAGDVPNLQGVYDACPGVFRSLIGRPPPPDLAANDFSQAQAMPGRYQFGVWRAETLVGVVDLKLDDDLAGEAHLGLLLLTTPYDDPDIGALVVRILARWLSGLGATALKVSVPAHDPAALKFWTALGFAFTGEQYRRELPGYAPRLLLVSADLAHLLSD